MDSNSPSGMYKCTTCLNVVAHNHGKEFLPCPKCNKLSWVIIDKDKDYLASIQQKDTIYSTIKTHNL